jgi:hypothetical protein
MDKSYIVGQFEIQTLDRIQKPSTKVLETLVSNPFVQDLSERMAFSG